jgi:hypothetical protein
MTPLLPSPDHYLQNLLTMTSPEAKRLWRRAIKEHFNCQCVYCGVENLMNLMNLLLITLYLVFMEEKQQQRIWFHPAGNVIRTKERITGSRG